MPPTQRGLPNNGEGERPAMNSQAPKEAESKNLTGNTLLHSLIAPSSRAFYHGSIISAQGVPPSLSFDPFVKRLMSDQENRKNKRNCLGQNH